MTLPPYYLEVVAEALSKLRAPAPAFAEADRSLIFGPEAAPQGLPDSTAKADCARWVLTLERPQLRLLAAHLLGLAEECRRGLAAHLRFTHHVDAGTLAHLEHVLCVNRTTLLGNLRELHGGDRRMMLRISGERRTGKTYTIEVIEALLGARSGGDHHVVPIDLSAYQSRPIENAMGDIFRARAIDGVTLPNPADVTPEKYIEQLAVLLVRQLVDRSSGASRTWIVFDRCAVADELPDLKSFLRNVAAAVIRYADDDRCPRVVFLEAEEELLRRYRHDIAEEELDGIDESELREFLERRGLAEESIATVLGQIAAALEKADADARLEEMRLTLLDLLDKEPPR